MGRIFEEGSDVDPILTHRVASGLAGNATINSTWQKILTFFGVQFKIETEQTIVNIGAWDMDTTSFVTVAHGLADITKIRSITGVFYDDAISTVYPLPTLDTSDGNNVIIDSISSTNITLIRKTGSYFDGTLFNDAVMNRGYLIIDSIP